MHAISVRTFMLLSALVPAHAVLGADTDPATLIIDAHSEKDGVSDPQYTPDAAVRVAVAWARVGHNVMLVTPKAVELSMKARLEKLKGAAPLAHDVRVLTYNSTNDLRTIIDAWERTHFAIPEYSYAHPSSQQAAPFGLLAERPRHRTACFGVVHVLGHGEIQGDAQVLTIPNHEADSLNIADLRNQWRLRCVPIATFLDVCRLKREGKAPVTKVRIRGRAPVDAGGKVSTFVIKARSQAFPLSGEHEWQTTCGTTVPPDEEAADAPDLLANRIAEALTIDGAEGDAHFRFSDTKAAFFTLDQLFECARIRLDDLRKQPQRPYISYGILTADHVVAAASKNFKYRAASVSVLERWGPKSVSPMGGGFDVVKDQDSGAIAITRNGNGNNASSTELSYLYGVPDSEVTALIASGRHLAIKVHAKPGTSGQGGRLQFEVNFSQPGPTHEAHQSVNIGETTWLKIESIPACKQIAFAAEPSLIAMDIQKQWPAGAELHILAMEFVDPDDKEAKGERAAGGAIIGNARHFWYAKHLLASHPMSNVVRISHGRALEMTFDVREVPEGKAWAGVGGPLYAVASVDESYTLQVEPTPDAGVPVSICVLDDMDRPLLEGELGKKPLRFRSAGKPRYFAILAPMNCTLAVETIQILRSP